MAVGVVESLCIWRVFVHTPCTYISRRLDEGAHYDHVCIYCFFCFLEYERPLPRLPLWPGPLLRHNGRRSIARHPLRQPPGSLPHHLRVRRRQGHSQVGGKWRFLILQALSVSLPITWWNYRS